MSEIKVNSVVNSTGDNDSGLDLSTNDQVTIKTANTTAVTVNSSQNVGIGTNSPSAKLSVNGATAFSTLELSSTSGSATSAFMGVTSGSDLAVKVNGSERMRIDSSGNVGIGEATPSVSGKGIEIYNEGNDTLSSIRLAGNNNTGTPGQKFNSELRFNGGAGQFQILHYGSTDSVGTERVRIVAGGDFYTNDGSVSSLSDRRVKKDITDLQDGLSIVNQLRPVTFKYNGSSSMTPDDNKVNYGFIADEVQAVASHYVTENTEEINGEKVTDFKSLSTGRMIPMLFKAVQELSAKVTTLQTEKTALEARITALENAE